MNVLLDTCTLLWLANKDASLSQSAQEALQAAGVAYVSSATAWELGIKVGKRKLQLPEKLERWLPRVIKQHHLVELPLDHKSAILSGALPAHHADPADRLLVAAALEHDLTLLTPDPLIQQYAGVMTVW